ncbi:MAG: hypothetical protein GC200_09690 [Tepidisphaera sp.]|nr:hypothetical protein [Tepidisphaera sp.]
MAKRSTKPKAEKASKALKAEALPEAPRLTPAPIALSALIGHDRAAKVLQDAMRSGRIHHAWIFHGPAGVGKCTAALAFGAVLLDPTSAPGLSGEIAPDPDSQTQRLLASGTHPDLHLVVKELAKFHDDATVRSRKLASIPIDVLRDFVLAPGALNASVRSEAMASKVFIIDEAELLNIAGQNALLKFLEEPPERTVIILVTSAEEYLLPTIRSRCQRVFFGSLSDADLRRWARGAGLELPAEQEAWLLEFASGSPGMLAAAITENLAAWWEKLSPLLARADKGEYAAELGPAMHELIDAWAKDFADKDDNNSKELGNRMACERMLRLVAAHLRRGLSRTDPARAADRLDAIRQAERALDSNVNMLFVFERLAAEISLPAGTPALA